MSDFRAGTIKVTRELIEMALDLPVGCHIAAIREEEPKFDTEHRDILVTLVGGEELPLVDPGSMPPFVNPIYMTDPSKFAGAKFMGFRLP